MMVRIFVRVWQLLIDERENLILQISEDSELKLCDEGGNYLPMKVDCQIFSKSHVQNFFNALVLQKGASIQFFSLNQTKYV